MLILRQCRDKAAKCVTSMAKKNSPQIMRTRSPPSSPPLGTGHYAGCKWSEPPLPSALPAPPQHWMQAQPHTFVIGQCQPYSAPIDIESHLKMVLKVQA